MEHVFAAQLRSLEQISLGQQQQTAMLGKIGLQQIEQLRVISNTMDALLAEMDSIRRTQAQGLALQQAMLAREVFQDKMEEFVYQAQKMIAEFQKPQPDYPPSTQFFLLDAMFKQIDQAGISTAVIKGRENKAAFDDCVAKGKTLYRQLTKNPEVHQAVMWAEGEKKRRQLADAEGKRRQEQGARQEELRRINERIRQLEARRGDSRTFGEWYKEKFGKIPVPLHVLMWAFWGFAWIPVYFALTAPPGQKAAFGQWYKRKYGKLAMPVHVLMWWFLGFAWIPLYYFGVAAPAEQKAASQAREDEIEKLRKRAALLQQPQ